MNGHSTRNQIVAGLLVAFILGALLCSCSCAAEWPRRLVRWPTRITYRSTQPAVPAPETSTSEPPASAGRCPGGVCPSASAANGGTAQQQTVRYYQPRWRLFR